MRQVRAAAPGERQQRYQHHIQPSDEPSLTRRRPEQTHLLQRCPGKQHQPGGKHRQSQLAQGHCRPVNAFAALPKEQRQQSQRPQAEPDGIEGERPHIEVAQPLRDKGKTPDGSRQ